MIEAREGSLLRQLAILPLLVPLLLDLLNLIDPALSPLIDHPLQHAHLFRKHALSLLLLLPSE